MRLGGEYDPYFVVLSRGAQLFPHHLEGDTYNFTRVLADIAGTPPGLRNLSASSWTSRAPDGSITEVRINEALPLTSDCQISFGNVEAQLRVR